MRVVPLILVSARKQISKYPKMSFPSRDLAPLKLLSVCRDEYFRMKVQWKSVSEEQEMRNSLLRGYRSLIGQHKNPS